MKTYFKWPKYKESHKVTVMRAGIAAVLAIFIVALAHEYGLIS